jgi:hypothetical protein
VCEYGDRRRKVVEKPYQEGMVVMVVSQAKRRGEDPLYEGLFTVVEFEEGKKQYVLLDEEEMQLKRGVTRKDLKLVEYGVEEVEERGGGEETYVVKEVVDVRDSGGGGVLGGLGGV